MIRGRPKPTVRSNSHKKINRYYDRKNAAEDKIIHLLEQSKIPRSIKREAFRYRKGGQVQGYMSDGVKVQCGKKFTLGSDDKEQYSQKEIFEAALRELIEE